MNIECPFESRQSIFDISNHIDDYCDVESRLLYDGCNPEIVPFISIIIPTYNSELLRNAIDSALSQDFKYPYEVVIVDNCGYNNEFILDYLQQHDKGVTRYFMNQKNIGMFGNWNRGITLSRAPYITYLHADDYFVSDTLSRLWNLHSTISDDAGIIGRFDIDNGKGKIIEKYNNLLFEGTAYKIGKMGLLFDDLDTGCGALFNRQRMMDLGGWNPGKYPAADRCFLLNYADRFGLYRINYSTRKETRVISESNTVNKDYPACIYYLAMEVINRYFKNGSYFLKLYGKCNYIIHTYFFKTKEKKNYSFAVFLFSRIYCFIIRRPYFIGKRKR